MSQSGNNYLFKTKMEKKFSFPNQVPDGMKVGLKWDNKKGSLPVLIREFPIRRPGVTLGLPPGKHEFMRVNKEGEKYEVERYLGNESDVYVRGSSDGNKVLKRNESTEFKRVFFCGKKIKLIGYLGNLIENQDK